MHKERFMSLITLFTKYGSYANAAGTDKVTTHSYGALYEELFTPRKNTAKNILEIGVYSGASLVVWSEFFPNAHIDGVDITLKNVFLGKDNPRITFHECDGTAKSTAEMLRKKYDVILDDGSHYPEHQIQSFSVFAPYINDGGIYVIEDINENYAEYVRDATAVIASQNGLHMEWHDLRGTKGRFDDIVATFTRKG